MRRTGPKGSAVSLNKSAGWALTEITDPLGKAIIDEYGPQAIIPYSYLAIRDWFMALNGGDAFFNKKWAQPGWVSATFCGESFLYCSWLLTGWPNRWRDPESFIHSK